MAKHNNYVMLGYEDELITEKYKNHVNYAVNKIGGEPDYPPNITKHDKNSFCALCNLPRRLIVQVYAPLDNSPCHRTLYIFACINPNCWKKSGSWICLRAQIEKNTWKVEETHATAQKISATDWCADADDWGDDENNANVVEENCNIINVDRGSDDESNSLEDSVQSNFASLFIDDKNANSGAQGGAVGRLHSPMASAEIEGGEGEAVTVEPPVIPQTNLAALLQEAPPVPQGTTGNYDTTPFRSYFMSVWPEEAGIAGESSSDDHVKELLTEYQKRDGDFLTAQRGVHGNDISAGEIDVSSEEYEKSRPHHGDKIFHNFLTKIKENPEQLLRYCREGSPLFLHPHQEPIPSCIHCHGEMVFEFQLIPTIISKLQLECDVQQCNRLEFGTVLVYACKKSCWSTNDSLREELVIVQQETF